MLSCLLLVLGVSPLVAQTATISTLYSFTGGADSLSPSAVPIQAGDGFLYGTTEGNILTDYGSVWKISPSGTFTTLHKFTGGSDSATLISPLYQGGDGNFYGTTYGNIFAATVGTVFQISSAGGTPVNLFNFTSATATATGKTPGASVIQGSDGLFYGVTSAGGTNGGGVLFKVGPTVPLATLVSFPAGGSPDYPPVQGSDGNFYGGVQVGTLGQIYQVTPSGVYTTLYSFKGTGDGDDNADGIVEGPDGNFYGTTGLQNSATAATGAYGTVFKITPTGVLTTLHVISGSGSSTSEGSNPSALYLAADGNFYGTVTAGAANGKGGIFKITPAGVYTLIYSFATTDPYTPYGGVVQGADGNFYGTGTAGAANAHGGIYKLMLAAPVAAPVQMTAASTKVELGQSVTLNWQVLNAFSQTMQQCYASSTPTLAASVGWNGKQAGTMNASTNIYSGSATFTPVAEGTYTFGITCGGIESATVSVVVGDAAALLITTSALPNGVTGTAYSATLGVSGGVAPFTWSLSAGALPVGVTLNPTTGVISGIPTTSGAFNATFKVTDSNPTPATASVNLGFTILQQLVISTTSLPTGRVGQAYSATLSASGGTPPYAWALELLSALPPGITLTAGGVLSGVPTASSSATVNFLVTDANSNLAETTLPLVIQPLIQSTGAVTLSPTSISLGGVTTASVTITPAASTPAMTGTVQFQLNGLDMGAVQTLPVGGGTLTLTTPAITATGPQIITATYSGDANYLPETYTAATLQVSATAEPSLTITPSAVSVSQGGTSSLTAYVYNFSSAPNFTCSGLPAASSCKFGTSTNSGAVTLQIIAYQSTAQNGKGTQTITWAVLLPGFLGLMGMAAGRKKYRRLGQLLPLAALLLLVSSLTACSSSNSSTATNAPVGTSTVTVTATAGSQVATTRIQLTIH